MAGRTKLWLVIAFSLVLIGCIMFGGVMMALNWDFTKLSTVKYETNEYKLDGEFDSISIDTDTADILFVLADKPSVSCYEEKNAKHSVSVKDGTLRIELGKTKKWYDYIGIGFETSKITVYLPKTQLHALKIKGHTGDVEIPKDFLFESMDIAVTTGRVANCASTSGDMKIKTTTGGISMENLSAGTIKISVSTGKIIGKSIQCAGDMNIQISTGDVQLSDVRCKALVSDGDTGDLNLKNVIAEERLALTRSTGDISFDGCDASEIFTKTSTGSVKGSLLSHKIFIAESDTGRVDVPKSVSGGRCEITTDTGSIKITVSPETK